MNRVILVGRITRDPELRNSPNGVPFTSFSIAVNRQMPNAQGERVADFINCVAFNKQAENLTRFIKKGGLIGVEGKLQSRTYQGQDGQTRYVTEVICDAITFLEPRSAQQSNTGYNAQQSYGSNFSQPQQQVNQPRTQNYGQAQPAFNQGGYQAGSYQQPAYQQPSYQPEQTMQNSNQGAMKQEDSFKDVEKQFEVSDDDLPF